MPGKSDIRILVVDDEPDVLELVVYHLEKEAYRVDVADTGDKALKMARENLPSLLVLDLMLPGINGLEICRLLKRDPKTRDIPILMLTARAAEEDRIKGLELGAHDYVTKPFSPRELVLRIKNLLRLTGKSPNGVELIEAGPFRLDTVRHQATADGRSLNITATEFKLLCLLASRPGEVQPRETLLRDVWGYEPTLDTRTVDTTMQRLRSKLGQAAHHLETVRGVGYRLIDLNA
ncbi:MAG: response regulator [Verrucomicrobia bacterium]|jgi:two-component system phosphate regulon response regulator PhoB|nr:response regulator [Verrucomicrobiota bacterium]MBT5619995.1 response regulator [Verrucomicrobiota bacterium]MBT6661220.1 response regulator [Verrucomicrobiota bacterium]MBT6788406.1 response regulator [Verrucomicrobiota bacterium]MBT7027230.1 response regulator [Verrucomicrobiota bacterium]